LINRKTDTNSCFWLWPGFGRSCKSLLQKAFGKLASRDLVKLDVNQALPYK
jgi:hypothetical protein